MISAESVDRIEPAKLGSATPAMADLIAELAAKSATLGKMLHPQTAANLSALVRIMNTYYSNLIEGHNTRPRDIERALAGEFDDAEERRDLQVEARAHVRVQAEIDEMFLRNRLPEPASGEFLRWLHREFYRDAPTSMLLLEGGGRSATMNPGEWRSSQEHDNVVGRHIPPSSVRVPDFMAHFAWRYREAGTGMGERLLAMAAAHHRFNYIHPFPDGNGRVSRLMSHAMAQTAGIGAHGLWSVSRGLARGLENRTEYKMMMDAADSQRRNDWDGRGNLSLRALAEFTLWFLRVCLDQVTFMSSLFEINMLMERLRLYVQQSRQLSPESVRLLEEALVRGQFERGEASRITGLGERSARKVLSDVIADGLMASDTPKGPVSLRFPSQSLDVLFPRLYVGV